MEFFYSTWNGLGMIMPIHMRHAHKKDLAEKMHTLLSWHSACSRHDDQTAHVHKVHINAFLSCKRGVG